MYASGNLRRALKTAIFFLLITAIFHSLSFLGEPQPKNDQEKQLIEITTQYKMDLGGGIQRSYFELFTALSSCFTMICLMAGSLLWYFLRNQLEIQVLKGLLNIYIIIFGSLFVIMAFFTFWPPILCMACITASLSWARLAS